MNLPALLVDAHAHIFKLDMPLIDNPRHRPTYSFTLADYLAQLDANQVGYGVIAAASPWGDFNDYTRECVKNTPRLRGTVILHPEKLDQYPLTRMTEEGILGIRLPFIGLKKLPDIRSPDYRRLFNSLADHGWHVHLHVEGQHIPDLLPHLENAGPRLVIDHLGRPEPDGVKDAPAFRPITDAVNRGKAWVKTSCGYRIGPVAEEHFHAYLQECGPDRLFWASDCPFVGHEGKLEYADTINWLDELVTDEEARTKIFGTNARDFYFPDLAA
jgi:predicted TIM-barrel fold metal-dependent hydrolase